MCHVIQQVVVIQVYGLQSRVFGESLAHMSMHFNTLIRVSAWLFMCFILVSTADKVVTALV